MHAPLQSRPFAPARSDTLIADIVPLDRRAARGFPRRKVLELRAASGVMFGLARFHVRKGHLVVSKFLCRKSALTVGLQLVRLLREEARYASAEEIWLEAKNDARAEAFYLSCGFQKKGYFRENPEDLHSLEKAIWSLKVEPASWPERPPLPN